MATINAEPEALAYAALQSENETLTRKLTAARLVSKNGPPYWIDPMDVSPAFMFAECARCGEYHTIVGNVMVACWETMFGEFVVGAVRQTGEYEHMVDWHHFPTWFNSETEARNREQTIIEHLNR